MSKQDKDLSDLVFHYQEDGSGVWRCSSCGEPVREQVDGASVFWIVKAQKEHVCPHEQAKNRLPVDRIRLREVLDELGTRIEILWTDYESAELVLVDKKTGAQLSLESETLG